MALNRNQEEIMDYVDGDAVERSNRKAEALAKKRYLEKYSTAGPGYDSEEYRQMVINAQDEVRQQTIKDMQYNREIERQRQLDDLLEQERRTDNSAFFDIQKQQDHRSVFTQHKVNWEENQLLDFLRYMNKNLLSEFSQISPNEIVDYYKKIAEQFSIEDSKTMREIIENYLLCGQPFDANKFASLVGDEEIKKNLQNNPDMSLEDIAKLMTQICVNRSALAGDYIDVAKKNIDTTIAGVDSKTELAAHVFKEYDRSLTDFQTSSLERDNVYRQNVINGYMSQIDRIKQTREDISNLSENYSIQGSSDLELEAHKGARR